MPYKIVKKPGGRLITFGIDHGAMKQSALAHSSKIMQLSRTLTE